MLMSHVIVVLNSSTDLAKHRFSHRKFLVVKQLESGSFRHKQILIHQQKLAAIADASTNNLLTVASTAAVCW